MDLLKQRHCNNLQFNTKAEKPDRSPACHTENEKIIPNCKLQIPNYFHPAKAIFDIL